MSADDAARRQALDPSRSFIVQAPAGSGKTELLIQRYLALLATVREPEQIVAITFTRKAAAEMRARVVAALEAAAARAVSGQRSDTLGLAQAALARDRERRWSLVEQPQRARIETLDALNGWLAAQLPVLSGGVAGAALVEDAREVYREAARRTLEALEAPGAVGESLRALAAHLDNSLERLEALLAELLPKRDQWLRHIAGANEMLLRAQLERALERLVAEELEQLRELLPDEAVEALPALLTHVSRHATRASVRADFEGIAVLPPASPSQLQAWRCVAELLLTAEGRWRRQLPRALGFGPEHPAARARLARLLDRLSTDEALREALQTVARLPQARYSQAQWRLLNALRIVLERLAAELRVLFAERHAVDFIELALAAQQALGRVDAPSELLLALDQRIQHVLVDEFQDTSHGQLELLRLLTAGWEEGDGRSLFLVGDPMQSIYRFRDADVSLFLKVKERGIGQVRCQALTLERNFRSAPAIVDWVNRVFPHAFPPRDEIGAGAAGFFPCRATRARVGGQCVELHALRSDDIRAELALVMEILERERERAPEQSVAVLVQSRSHLAGLHEHLGARGWPAHAVEIDALDQLQLGQDLIGLTRALTHLGDRVAWLGVLRAPWCGLRWADLEALVYDAPDRAVWALLHEDERLASLSADAAQRVRWLRVKLGEAFQARANTGLAAWVERTWNDLDGPACLDRAEDEAVAEAFFATLAVLERRGDLDDPPALEEAFARAQRGAPAPDARDARIEIMTIHRAKGLEFDTVVLPGLGRAPRRDAARALYWMERVAKDGTDDLLMAPLARADEHDALTSFVRRAESRRDLAERARLLYVAATRARERLHLVAALPPNADRPPSRSLLAPMWSELASELAEAPPAGAGGDAGVAFIEPVLRRLAAGVADPTLAPERREAPADPRLEFEWAGQAAVHVGTVVHRFLQRLASLDPSQRRRPFVEERAGALRRELELLGVEERELGAATERTVRALCGVLEDPTGQWLLDEHEEARSELRLTLRAGAALEHVRLDRTFVENGVRWIVDYKVSTHEGGELEAFLDEQTERYRPQLERYAELLAQMEDRPIRVGLYFPLLRAFRSWPAGCSEPL